MSHPLTLTLDSPVGRLTLTSDGRALTRLAFGAEDLDEGGAAAPDDPILRGAARWLADYFGGSTEPFDLPLEPEGTAFQREVWAALQAIPHGRTLSYAQLAAEVGRPQGAQAVGAANGANPIPILIPCHRVVGADGELVGYLGGLEAKRLLLRLEGISIPIQGDLFG